MYYVDRYNSTNITLAESAIYYDHRNLLSHFIYFNEILTTIITFQPLYNMIVFEHK